MVLDDFHWADAPVGGAAQALLRGSAEHAALQVVVTYRESDLGKDHPLTGRAGRSCARLPGVERIALGGLGDGRGGADPDRCRWTRAGRGRGCAGGSRSLTETGWQPVLRRGDPAGAVWSRARLVFDEADGALERR